MTIITKLTTSGFKSFAKKTDLVFGNKFNCIIGPNGSGKSASYFTNVVLKNGSEILLGDLVENKLKGANNIKKLNDGVYCSSDIPVEILSLDPKTMKVEFRRVSNFIRREGEPFLFKITTKSGKSVKTTGCHPVMIFKNGKIKSSKVEHLSIGDVVTTPREINISGNNKGKDFARLFGYLIGDGFIHKKRIEFINKDKEVLHDFKNLVEIIFGVKPKNIIKGNNNIERLIYYDKDFIRAILSEIKNEKEIYTSPYKYIPENILKGSKEVISNILGGLYDTDGHIGKRSIEFCTKNDKLANQIQMLLLRYGIISKKKKRICFASNTKNKTKRDYYYIYISGYQNYKRFYTQIPLKCIYKKEKLFSILKTEKNSNPNVDLLPKETNFLTKKAVELLGLKVKMLRKEYPKLAAYCENRCNPSREGLAEILELFKTKLSQIVNEGISLKLDQLELVKVMDILSISGRETRRSIGVTPSIIKDYWEKDIFKAKPANLDNFFNFIQSNIESRLYELREIMKTLYNLANSDIFWDEIVSIEKVEGEKYVYDLTIPKTHNFIGDGIFIHNSNVMDALCFVLGKSSAKGLRADKSSNLIYNGGKKGNPSKKAEVHLFFDNSKKEFPFNTQEVKISRILNQKGISKYKINDKSVTRQQMIDMLNKVGVDPDGHNIILQGDIVHFMEMKPDSRRELIEEIAGISIFEDKKNKALNELEKVGSKLTEANVLLAEREANLRELKKERDQAKRYVNLRNKIKDSKATYISLKIKNKKEKRDSIQKVYNDYNSKLENIQEKIKSIRNVITQKQEEVQKINYELDQKGEGEQKILQMDINNLTSSIFKHEARIGILKNELIKIKNRRKQLLEDISENKKKISMFNKKNNELKNKAKENENNLRSVNNKILEFKKKYGIQNIDDINIKLNELDKNIEEKEKLMKEATETKQEIIRKIDKVSFKLDSINKELDMINKSRNSSKLKELRKKHDVLEKALNKVIGEDSILAKNYGENWSKLNSSESELAKLRAKEAGIKEGISNNRSIERVKKISGVLGTISELGEVEDKYALAMEVSAGMRIKSVVVNSDIIASKCIQELKRNKAGVVTFLPLNKIKPRVKQNVKEIMKKNGVYGLAIDLIKFDKKFKNVFDYVFGSTLVIDKIETARKIGIGKIRMVTLEGDLVESSGAMVGGYRGRSGIGFNQKEITGKLSTLSKEVDMLNKRIQKDMSRRNEIDYEIESLRKKKSEIYGDMANIERSLGISGNSKDLLKDKKDLDENKLRFENELKIIENDILKFNSDIGKLKKEKNEIKDKLINNPEIKNNLNKLESKKDLLKGEILNFNSEKSIIQNQIEMYSNEIKKVNDILEGHGKEELEFKREMDDLVKVVKNKKINLKEKETKEKEFYGKNKSLAIKRNKIMDFINLKEGHIANEEEKTNSIRNKSNDVSIRLAKAIGEVEGLEIEFEEYKDGIIRKNVSVEKLKSEISEFEKIMNNIGNINMRALEIYDDLAKQYDELLNKTNKLKDEKDDVLSLIGEIESKKTDVFMKIFNHLKVKFKDIFSSISIKGQASLVLENEDKPLEGGVDINVKVSGNKLLDIRSLSGGEKTLAALSFIFAMQEYNPASFYLLDEVDAALDKHNSEKLSKLISDYSKKAQYVVISHNDSIITEASQIYGTSMNDGVTKVISLKI